MSETKYKSAEEVLKEHEWLPGGGWTYEQILKAMDSFHAQFKVSDEEIWSDATSLAIKQAREDDDTLLETRRSAIVEGMKAYQDKIFKP